MASDNIRGEEVGSRIELSIGYDNSSLSLSRALSLLRLAEHDIEQRTLKVYTPAYLLFAQVNVSDAQIVADIATTLTTTTDLDC